MIGISGRGFATNFFDEQLNIRNINSWTPQSVGPREIIDLYMISFLFIGTSRYIWSWRHVRQWIGTQIGLGSLFQEKNTWWTPTTKGNKTKQYCSTARGMSIQSWEDDFLLVLWRFLDYFSALQLGLNMMKQRNHSIRYIIKYIYRYIYFYYLSI